LKQFNIFGKIDRLEFIDGEFKVKHRRRRLTRVRKKRSKQMKLF